jgi:vesicle coat complex subunit
MSIKSRSCKNKGKRLQNEIVEIILEYFPELTSDDVKSNVGSESGVDIQLSTAAKKLFPYSIEAKNQETTKIWSWIEQTEKNCHPDTTPLLIFRRNRSKTYVTLKIEDFFKLLK